MVATTEAPPTRVVSVTSECDSAYNFYIKASYTIGVSFFFFFTKTSEKKRIWPSKIPSRNILNILGYYSENKRIREASYRSVPFTSDKIITSESGHSERYTCRPIGLMPNLKIKWKPCFSSLSCVQEPLIVTIFFFRYRLPFEYITITRYSCNYFFIKRDFDPPVTFTSTATQAKLCTFSRDRTRPSLYCLISQGLS